MAKTIKTQAVDDLFEAILSLQDKEECYKFFEVIFTTNEVLGVAERFEVAKLLYDAGCISDVRLYKIRTKIYDAKYVPGTYKVSPSFSTEKIINILSGYDYSTDGVMEES